MIKGFDFYKTYLHKLDDHLVYNVGQILLIHDGLGKAINRVDLVEQMEIMFPEIKEMDRKVRRVIEELRNDGWLIGSSPNGEGYFMIQTKAEYENFKANYVKRAYKVIETSQRMDEAAKMMFANPSGEQLSLLG